MQYPLDLWIKVDGVYERLDTFKDEGITIKESVKNFDDIKKIFTALSRSFTIPASKKNNKILKHFHRGDIFGVDARALIDAKLTLNGVDYKYGNISLEGAKMKENSPYCYSVRFYGNLTELNKLISDDELTDLDLSAYDIPNPIFINHFSSSTPTNRDVAFPLLSKYRRFISHSSDYDYAQTQGYNDTANVSYSVSTRAQGYYGVTNEDLVGAIRVGAIIDAIESRYGINFTGILNDAGYVRYLRLLLQKRGSDGLSGSELVTKSVSNFTPSQTKTRFSSTANGFDITTAYAYVNSSTYKLSELDVTVTTTAPVFKVHVKRNGEIVETIEATGTYTINTGKPAYNNSIITFDIECSGFSTVGISTTFETFTRVKLSKNDIESATMTASTSFVSGSGDYIVRENLPTMKVVDFLSDLFKRFNIVATVDKDLNVDTQHFDYYINKGKTIDVTKYIDISNHEVSRPNFHSGIHFTTEPVKTVGEYGFQKVNGRKYGELKFNLELPDGKLDGEPYKVDLKSSIIPIDIPYDVDYGGITNFRSMLLVDKRGEEAELGATFLYTIIQNNKYIAYDTGSTVTNITNYMYLPSEVYYDNEVLSGGSSEFTLGNYFSEEISPISVPSYRFKDANLFNAFYSKTISIAFGETSRRVKYDAYLPMKVLHSLSPADVLKIGNKTHIIESYSTNFLTGKTSLELMQVDDSITDLFTTQSVNVVGVPSLKSSNFISADTGRATHIRTNNTTSHNVVGGESGIYRVQE